MHYYLLKEKYIIFLTFSISIINLLFNGIYKEIFAIPFNLTIFFAITTAVLSSVFLDLSFLKKIISNLVTILLFCLFISLIFKVDFLKEQSFGQQKMLDFIFLAAPCFVYGVMVSRHPNYYKLFQRLMLFLAIILSALIIIDTYVIALPMKNLFYANYQLIGYFMSLSMFFALQLKTRWLLIMANLIFIAILCLNSVPTLLFNSSILIMFFFYIFCVKDRRLKIRALSLITSICTSVLIVSLTMGLPPAVHRTIWKIEANLTYFTHETSVDEYQYQEDEYQYQEDEYQYQESVTPQSTSLFSVPLLPIEERENYVSRAKLFEEAYRQVSVGNLHGIGLGEFLYKGYRTPHNIFIEILLEAGFISFLLLCSVFATLLYKIICFFRRNKKLFYLTIPIFFIFSYVILINSVSSYFIGRIDMFMLGLVLGIVDFRFVKLTGNYKC